MKWARRMVYRSLRSLGLTVGRRRDPYNDAARFLHGQAVTHVIDGGAYLGGAAARMAAVFPQATIHAFEPQAETFQALERSLGLNPRVRLYPAALSDHTGQATLHVNSKAYTTSLLPTTDVAVMGPVDTQDVTILTLDAWAADHGDIRPQFLKLDLQGHELAALRGAERMIGDSVGAILTEVNLRRRYQGSCLLHEIAAYLDGFAFRLHRLYEIIDGADGGWEIADALFIRESMFMSASR